MNTRLTRVAAAFGVFAQSSFGYGTTDSLDDLLSMSLQELANRSYLSATSKTEESAIQAPGIISYITREEIDSMGANNLLDLLRRLPNFDVPSLYLFRNNLSSVRAQHADSTDTRTLILLNGRPMRESYNGGVNSPIYDGFPLSSIDSIEVIRGPGSVLHGSGAFSAVINIVTRKAKAETAVDAQLSYGSFDTRMVDATASSKIGDWEISGGIKTSDIEGWDYEALDSAGVAGSMDYGQQLHAATFRAVYQSFSFEYFESHSKTDVLGTEPLWPQDKADLLRRFMNTSYEHAFSDAWRSEASLTYNEFEATTEGPINENGSEDFLLEITTFGQLTDSASVTLGGSREKQSWYRDNFPKDDGGFYINRFYAEAVYRPVEQLRLAIGGQYNEADGSDSNTSPRLAATYQFTDNWGMKVLYGEAFRAAASIERFANIPAAGSFPGFVGKEDLKPETISTLDTQLYYYDKDVFAALTFYKSKEEDTIVLDFTQAPLTYGNGEDIKYHGVEFEFKWDVSESLFLEGSYSYQSNEDSNGNDGVKLTPARMAKIGAKYQVNNGISLGVFNSYFERYETRDTAVIFNEKNESYNHLSANVVLDLNWLLNIDSRYRSSISVYGDNLLESDPGYAPDVARGELNTLPIRSERAVYVTYRLQM